MELLSPAEQERIFRSIPDETFDRVKHCVLFVGHGHSGHSIVGAILDAHPRIAISNELNAVHYFQAHDFDRIKVFKLMLSFAVRNPTRDGWTNTAYRHTIAGSSQGQDKPLEVIGDKKGGATARFAATHPEFSLELIRRMGNLLKIIFVIRNPYDVIAAKSFRTRRTVGDLIEGHFQALKGILLFQKNMPPDQFLTIHHERLIADKENEIRRLVNFVGQDTPEDYLQRCAGALYETAHPRRFETAWVPAEKALVQTRMESAHFRPFYQGYSFESNDSSVLAQG